MTTRRGLLCGLVSVALAGCSNGDTGTEDSGLSVSLPAFDDGVPTEYTCDGEDVSPPVAIEGVPDDAESLALVVDDPDAPGETPFVHWLVWNVSPGIDRLPAELSQSETLAELDDAPQGRNDFDELGYRGPCPPASDDAHTYRFTVFAVGTTLSVDPGGERDALEAALEGNVLAEATATAEYDR